MQQQNFPKNTRNGNNIYVKSSINSSLVETKYIWLNFEVYFYQLRAVSAGPNLQVSNKYNA